MTRKAGIGFTIRFKTNREKKYSLCKLTLHTKNICSCSFSTLESLDICATLGLMPYTICVFPLKFSIVQHKHLHTRQLSKALCHIWAFPINVKEVKEHCDQYFPISPIRAFPQHSHNTTMRKQHPAKSRTAAAPHTCARLCTDASPPYKPLQPCKGKPCVGRVGISSAETFNSSARGLSWL